MVKQRSFSLYDIEEFLKQAGAEKINEKAVISLEQELEDTVKELVGEASFYANYAGRSNMIKSSDLELAKAKTGSKHILYARKIKRRRIVRKSSESRIVLRRVRLE
ncbi:MAG: hypothetical protein M1544_03830 [Candidatus Marsarchaeota archaeon]|nr:hypothetical protein [Candidatus Marsarchaeota archaeon]